MSKYIDMTPEFIHFVGNITKGFEIGVIKTSVELNLLDLGINFTVGKFLEMGKTTFTVDEIRDALPTYCGAVFNDDYDALETITVSAILEEIKRDAKVGYSGLTADGKKHDSDKDGALDKGTVVTCKAVKTVGSDIWMQIPSGWIAAYYDGDIYVK